MKKFPCILSCNKFPLVSSTISTFAFTFSDNSLYMLLLILSGILPESTRMSPSFKCEIFSVSSFSFSPVISGDNPVSSVSLSLPFTFTFILVFPSSSTNSALMLSSFKSLTIKSPTKPAT